MRFSPPVGPSAHPDDHIFGPLSTLTLAPKGLTAEARWGTHGQATRPKQAPGPAPNTPTDTPKAPGPLLEKVLLDPFWIRLGPRGGHTHRPERG